MISMTSFKVLHMALVVAAVVAVALSGLFAISRGRGKGPQTFFGGDSKLRWFTVAAGLYVAVLWTSWIAAIGLGIDGARGAWVIAAVGVALGLIAVTFVSATHDRPAEALTLTGALAPKVGSATGFMVAVVLLVSILFIWIPLTLTIGSRMLSALTGWDVMTCGLMIIVVPGLLIVAGGQSAVVSIHAVAAVATIVGLIPAAIGGGLMDARVVDAQAGLGQVHWLVLLVGAGVNTFWFVSGDQAMFQRIGTVAGTPALRTAGLTAGALVILSAASFLAGGDIPLLAADDGLSLRSGMIGAAILTLAMASLSGYVMSFSTLLCLDFPRLFRKHPEPHALVLSGRLVASATVIISILAMSFVSLVDTRDLLNLIRVLVVMLVPVSAAAGIAMFLDKGWGKRVFLAMLVGAFVGSISTWGITWGASEQESLVLASMFSLAAVAAVLVLPIRSVRATTRKAADATRLAGVRK
jgi:hypothetical protein